MFNQGRRILVGAVAAAAMAASGGGAFAHCDGLDGPVVSAARTALETGDVERVLIWVGEDDEPEIREAFSQTLSVRDLSPEARALADRYFFETLVRVHRAGEGAPYTGLKPAGRDLGPAIPAADEAVASGEIDALASVLVEALEDGLEAKFQTVLSRRDFEADDVDAGRDFVQAYVSFIHYAERAYEAAASPAEHHYPEEH